MRENKVLLIIGMHRSGTSMLAQWLWQCGLHVGDRLLEAGLGNDDGHYEDLDSLDLHKIWLNNRSLPNDNGFIAGSLTPLTEAEKEQAALLVLHKNGVQKQWGWKEPRTCLWLPLYRNLLPSAFSIIIVRSFNDTVNSMVMREYRNAAIWHGKKVESKKGLSKLKWKYLKAKNPDDFFTTHATEFLRIWSHYNEEILRHIAATDNNKVMIVHFENLLQNDQIIFDTLTNRWKLSLHYVSFSSLFKRGLLSKTRDIRPYVKDKAVLKKAEAIEERFKSLMHSKRSSAS